jgi:hypothetical protein
LLVANSLAIRVLARANRIVYDRQIGATAGNSAPDAGGQIFPAYGRFSSASGAVVASNADVQNSRI